LQPKQPAILHSRHVSIVGGAKVFPARGWEALGRRKSGRETASEEVEPETTLVRAATMTESSCSGVRVAREKEEEEDDIIGV